MKILIATTLIALALLPATILRAQAAADPVGAICTDLYRIRLDDKNDILSESTHRHQLKTILSTQNLQDYSDLQTSSQKLGFDLSVAGQALGLDEGSKSDRQQFQHKLQTFLSSSDEESTDSSLTIDRSSKLNSSVLAVIKSCQDHYFDALKNTIRLSVEVVPQNSKEFSVYILANIPAQQETPLKIKQLVPSKSIRCYDSKHHNIAGTLVVPSQSIIIECTKNPKAAINFAVQTNAGTSPFLTIPAAPSTSSKAEPLRTISVQWKPQAPALGQPIRGHCGCSAVTEDSNRKIVSLTNNCNGLIQALAVKQTIWSGAAGEFLAFPANPGPNVVFGYASIPRGATADFDSSDTAMGRIDFISCPADATIVPTRIDMRVFTERPVCFVRPGPGGTESNLWNICETTQRPVKAICNCPAQLQQKSMNGYVVRMNYVRTTDHLPCDLP